MGFEKFGHVSFTSQTKTDAFVEYLVKDEIRATKCRKCGVYFFPPQADCSSCLESDMDWVKLKAMERLLVYQSKLWSNWLRVRCALYTGTG